MKKIKIELRDYGFWKSRMNEVILGSVIMDDQEIACISFINYNKTVELVSYTEIDENIKTHIIYEILRNYSSYWRAIAHASLNFDILNYVLVLDGKRSDKNILIELLDSEYCDSICDDILDNVRETYNILKENRNKIGRVKIYLPINPGVRKKLCGVSELKEYIFKIVSNYGKNISVNADLNKENIIITRIGEDSGY